MNHLICPSAILLPTICYPFATPSFFAILLQSVLGASLTLQIMDSKNFSLVFAKTKSRSAHNDYFTFRVEINEQNSFARAEFVH